MRPAEPPAKTLKTTTHLSQGRRGRLSVVAREGRGQGRETGQQDSRSIMAARGGRECRWAGDHANHTFFMSSQLGSSSSRLSLHEPCLQPKKDRRQEYDVSFFSIRAASCRRPGTCTDSAPDSRSAKKSAAANGNRCRGIDRMPNVHPRGDPTFGFFFWSRAKKRVS